MFVILKQHEHIQQFLVLLVMQNTLELPLLNCHLKSKLPLVQTSETV